MYAPQTILKPLSSIQLGKEETTIVKWLRSAQWEPVKDAKTPIPYRAKVPEFFGGVQLYRMQGGAGGGAVGALELFIKKLGMQGVIGKQELYPLIGHGTQPRYVALKKAELDNLGVGQEEEDEE